MIDPKDKRIAMMEQLSNHIEAVEDATYIALRAATNVEVADLHKYDKLFVSMCCAMRFSASMAATAEALRAWFEREDVLAPGVLDFLAESAAKRAANDTETNLRLFGLK